MGAASAATIDMSLYKELKRRNVIRVAAGYVVVAWLLIQVAGEILPPFGVGDDVIRLIIIAIAIGFIPVVVLAWVFEWTPEGIRKDEEGGQTSPSVSIAAKRWDRIVLVVLAVAVAYFVTEKVLEQTDAEPTIAVLPFTILSDDPEQKYLAAGIAEEIRSMLAGIPELQVTWHQSAFAPELHGLEISQIAERLGVAHIVTGTFRKAGNVVRVSTQLIATHDNSVVWGETFERQLHDVFDIQEGIAENIVDNLHVEMLGQIPRVSRTDPKVLGLVIQAQQVFFHSYGTGNYTTEGDRMAALLDQALQIDPNHAPAIAWYTYAEWLRWRAGLISAEEEQRRHRRLKERALAIDPNQPMILHVSGLAEWRENGDPVAAAPLYELAIRSGFSNSEVLRHAGRFAYMIDHYDEAAELLERSVQLNPLCRSCLYQLSRGQMITGRFEEAEDTRRRFILSLEPGSRVGYYHYGVIKLLLGETEAALEIFDEMAEASQPFAPAGRAMALYSLGRYEESDQVLESLLTDPDDYMIEEIPKILAWRGQNEEAFLWIHRGIENISDLDLNGFEFLQWLRDPLFANLHDDPRWGELRPRLGWPTERLAAIDVDLSLPE